MDKKTGLKLVQNNEAKFLREKNTGKDGWEQTYHYTKNGEDVLIKVTAVGQDRWIMDDEDLVTIVESF